MDKIAYELGQLFAIKTALSPELLFASPEPAAPTPEQMPSPAEPNMENFYTPEPSPEVPKRLTPEEFTQAGVPAWDEYQKQQEGLWQMYRMGQIGPRQYWLMKSELQRQLPLDVQEYLSQFLG